MKTYLVGGAVRDKLLGISVKDRDWVVVGSTVEEMLAQDFQQVGKDFPVFLHPETNEEYALARTERKSGKGYTGFTVHADKSVSLEEDLQRRDLTINAIAEDESGNLIDPFNGQQDLEAKILRHVSSAFTEDHLRVLRVARFAARFHHLGFSIADETKVLMETMTGGGELSDLVSERVWTEIESALRESSPQIFIQILKHCEALAVILPEVNNLYGVPQPPKYHPEIDTGIHTLMALQQAALLSPDPVVRFAALMHDVGKGAIPEYLASLTSLYHTHCHRAATHSAEELLETLEQTDAFRKPERFEQFLLACEADSRGRLGLENNPYPQPEVLKKALAACANVDTSVFIEQGYKDAQIGEQIRLKRLTLIQEALEIS
jgi:tRNA nucleotidyltransferase (CCA-adding enzyme)